MRVAILLCLAVGACGDGGESTVPDASLPDAMVISPDADTTVLSNAGFYADFDDKTVAADLVEYEPAYELWADGAAKRRFLYLPPGTTIDVTDPDHWVFPVGTRVWKEFSLDGVLLETRLIEKRAADAYRFAVYVWREDGSDAELRTSGAQNVRGTAHDVPTSAQCLNCHVGEPDRLLGLSLLQLSPPSTFLATLVAADRLSTDLAPVAIPGDEVTRAAFGVLHANCGHCHNPEGSAFSQVDMVLRISAQESAVTPPETSLWSTTVDIPTTSFMTGMGLVRVGTPPAGSVVTDRMSEANRGTSDQMPPFATELPDQTGVEAILAWIATLDD
jgi:hypothetical protein